jgi:hypothetical protein
MHRPGSQKSPAFLTHAKMYEVGDKYGVHGLKELSREKFLDDCKPFWEAEGFAVAAKHAFSITPEDNKGLRKVVTVLRSLRETALIVEAALTGGYLPARG